MWVQNVEPDTTVQDYAGFCLRFVQSVNGAPAKYASAWDAWQATVNKFYSRELPNVSIPCWFEHWGSYGQPATYDNWGHVVQYVPGQGFLGSPVGKLGTYGQSWFATLEEVERVFNAKFVGWSTDINGLTVASDNGTPIRQGSQRMATLYYCQEIDTWALAGDGQGQAAWLETKGAGLATAWSAWFGGAPNVIINKQTWDAWKAQYMAGASNVAASIDYVKLAKAVFDEQAKRLQS